MADRDLTVHLKADDKITPAAKDAAAALEKLERKDVSVDVKAPGLDDLTDKLGSMPGVLGDVAGGIGKLGAAGGVTALATGMFAAATAAKDLALEAKTTADLTGSTVEDASKLQNLWGRTGADVNDLNDVLLQMNGALAQSPELAAQLGINLNDGKNITQRFVEMTDKLAAGQLTAVQASQLFGEEGVRQVGKLRTVFGGLSDDLEGMPAPIDDEDVQQALEMERAIGQLTDGIKRVAGAVAQELIPMFTEAANAFNNIGDALPDDGGGLGSWITKLNDLATQVIPGANLPHILEEFNNLVGDGNDEAAAGADIWGMFNRAIDDAVRVLRSAANSQSEYSDAVADTRTELEGQVAAIYAAMAAEEEQAAARRAQADAGIAARDAQREFVEQLTKSNEVLATEGVSLYDVAAAMDEAALSAAKVADEQVRLADETFAAQGKVVSSTSKQSLWNQSMLESARTAEGPLRDSIVNYIATVNGIPAEKVSEILANPDYATIAEAAAALDAAAHNRDADIIAAAKTGAAEAALNDTARTRTARINVALGYDPRYGPSSGGPSSGGTMVAATTTTAAPMVAATTTTAAPMVVNVPRQTPTITINAAVVGSRFDVDRTVTKALRRHQRLNGERP